MDVVRIGLVETNGRRVLVAEMFGIPLALGGGDEMLAAYEADPEGFAEGWGERFRYEMVSMLAEKIQNSNRRMTGWGMVTRLSPPPPHLPREDA